MPSAVLYHFFVEVAFEECLILSRGSVSNVVPVITGVGWVREPLKMPITRANECCCGKWVGGFLKGRLAILLALELLRKSE